MAHISERKQQKMRKARDDNRVRVQNLRYLKATKDMLQYWGDYSENHRKSFYGGNVDLLTTGGALVRERRVGAGEVVYLEGPIDDSLPWYKRHVDYIAAGVALIGITWLLVAL